MRSCQQCDAFIADPAARATPRQRPTGPGQTRTEWEYVGIEHWLCPPAAMVASNRHHHDFHVAALRAEARRCAEWAQGTLVTPAEAARWERLSAASTAHAELHATEPVVSIDAGIRRPCPPMPGGSGALAGSAFVREVERLIPDLNNRA